ncbi:MAG: pyruvate dehydrogenase (acetyl-transferring), homodimeric type [Kiritimatiellia bacterium]|mgnify:CR=1 FL=1|jgi:pyruvate dehydrogenase E1 component|nr:pyruvate dehydrogenase (acetyl-transferring), homodimeric type [Pseudomonadales bacterium]MDP6470901.1 pyruvate dehydrogenase (acetyl-transferring), homodimeric type [Pseudomonadales bacterium]MDP6825914.1 pyruvate dehydrogenase (acetyl-transferring), homodimeric type [Pseudomonadales bacterium]MDP7024546.1 pyruvate dehydrogenase (acetyl-transferring), homodimeric type [Kiritimatiellia bacterium]
MAYSRDRKDEDPQETREWLDSLEYVLENTGVDRANFLLERLSARMTRTGARLPYTITTPYRNTIPSSQEAFMPGDLFMERRIRSLIRWNALAMVVRANRQEADLGGHISSFASSATLYDVGFNYFFRGPGRDDAGNPTGDLIYFQGHSAPGVYARSFLEGRLSEEDLDNFRREVGGEGLSSYPHPWLMPNYWQFPTVSMGLGPLQAIYQAHVMKYLDARDLVPMGDRKVWAFLGDGECDEPESLGALALAGREKLDNLIFVVNCNLQRLDGPVRGNGKIIQELEGYFRGAGWNVIKVVWGRLWDPLFARDAHGLMQQRMNETVDGEYQNFKAKGGAYVRETFFGTYPELLEMVSHLSDEDIYRLNRGGHDPFKIYAAYHRAVNHSGEPTVILAKTVKGYGMGDAGESENDTHSVKKLNFDELKHFRDRFDIPLSDSELGDVPYYRPKEDSPELVYMCRQRERLGGSIPQRLVADETIGVPPLEYFETQLKGTGERANSTTMAFVRILAALVRDKGLGDRIVPIVPDEARTFGMEGMFHRLGIYSSEGQLYEPEDSEEIAAYRESRDGQVLEEGINEAGAMSGWIAAATSYSTHRYTLIPFYIYYSMFGFQRIGDLAWAAGDMQARGFLLGGTSGRTTLNGEGLQHQDGHSHVLAGAIPNCVSYDPCYAYELAVIIQDGLRRMVAEKENVFFYVTVMNESYPQPAMPEGVAQDILRGIYRLRDGNGSGPTVRLLGSGTILREVEAAAEMLESDYGVSAEVYSVTSFVELARNGADVARWNLLHPEEAPRESHVGKLLTGEAPVVIASDYLKSLAEPLRAYIGAPCHILGTDGFGRSDTRSALRHFFEVDRRFVTLAALSSLASAQQLAADKVRAARDKLGIDAEKTNPRTV